MNKQERAEKIRKRAYEYAKSGEYDNWLSIEWQIRSEGLSEARHVLDNPRIRKELDTLCETANSPEEAERRQNFQVWLKNILPKAESAIKNFAPDASLFVRDLTLLVNGPNYSNEIKRCFGSNEMEVIKVWEESDGQRHRMLLAQPISSSDFRHLDGEKLITFIKRFIKTEPSKAV